ncbi:cytochrome c-type biogenesis protein CcmF [Allopseudospirillum japonicum]|uniref:Cytochrome c-type biogenesis protein CcmF n=1 Tax=Allopseudospirillum japonicum TaxID=64971 RepID=A0A1H6R3R3_9GAMM|nr:heme lyase CcmF/NrfE family subunit [Allopseudospirillum japonicum]SEI46245.1 cytochrome c-type biogenesis protein CcmF [Allopseudospirillum japonicum]
MWISILPELGHYALILALCFALVQSSLPLWGTYRRQAFWMAFAQPMALGQFFFLSVSLLLLSLSFLLDDFSVAYIANNSNSALPWYYKISAVWGSHEGSLLLWLWILAAWTAAVGIFSRALPRDLLAQVLAVMGWIAVGFGLFVLLTSNPFARLLPDAPLEGGDLNPLLQDIGLILHPPMLYMGYVGFSVAFAFAIAALLNGRLDAAWARWSRPWTSAAWAFLTIGIALGSWWAYYELGWGGWWFWDPVENASLMPWLVGTALMHSLAVTEKRGVFKSWTVLLAIFAFSLSLLGTFLVRSGVLTSVHAFASDPERGYFILVFLALVVGGSLFLYALKAPAVKSHVSYSLLSKEMLLLVNNILLVVICVTVLLGTIYPLILDALGLGKISVGPPYFNALFVPLTSLLCIALGIGPLVNWRTMARKQLVQRIWLAGAVALGLGMALPWVYGGEWNLYVALGGLLAVWLVGTQVRDLLHKTRHAKQGRLQALKGLGLSYWGMQLGHLGVALCVVGVTLVSNYSAEKDVRMEVGQSIQVGDYFFRFEGIRQVQGPNYTSDQGVLLRVSEDNQVISTLLPEKRLYLARRQVMTEAAIEWGLMEDIYVAMGEPLPDGAWAIRIHYKPFVRWLWIGGLVMALGGLLAVADKRYRQANPVQA